MVLIKGDENSGLITKITGGEAVILLYELEIGAGIHFRTTFDNNDNPVIELHREKWGVDNLPDDKKILNQFMY